METIDFDIFPTLVRWHRGVIEEQRRKDIFEYIMAKGRRTRHRRSRKGGENTTTPEANMSGAPMGMQGGKRMRMKNAGFALS
jgi:hypothetical protein